LFNKSFTKAFVLHYKFIKEKWKMKRPFSTIGHILPVTEEDRRAKDGFS